MDYLWIILFLYLAGKLGQLYHYRNIRKIDKTELLQRMKDKRTIILDVRTNEEYTKKKIPHSILMPIQRLRKDIAKKIPDKTMDIVVYCHSGSRSKRAARILYDMGYRNIKNFGKLEKW